MLDPNTRVIDLTVAQLQALIASTIAEQSTSASEAPSPERLVLKRFACSRAWLRANVASTRGPRQQLFYRPADVNAALTANPQTRTARPRVSTDESDDPFEAMLASGALKRGKQ